MKIRLRIDMLDDECTTKIKRTFSFDSLYDAVYLFKNMMEHSDKLTMSLRTAWIHDDNYTPVEDITQMFRILVKN